MTADPVSFRRPVGRAVLALLCALVALLALMVAGSKILVGGLRGDLADWQAHAVAMLATTLAYAVMGAACWAARRWLRWYAVLALLALVVLALTDLSRNDVLDLASALVYLLAMAVNMAVLGYIRLQR